jgi:hypothetical protein
VGCLQRCEVEFPAHHLQQDFMMHIESAYIAFLAEAEYSRTKAHLSCSFSSVGM